ncbi:AAA family ATPase [Komagataeibacter rhaeticus]|uniref:AAA family ATPase n=1 Tax=Komagataeibacter rhaeticus TaxID=215221 RepID=UPI0009FD2BC0|nr:AAA family ATPase [Komagataeibacter rhaeticus]MBL7241460.1 AAA family ATPase [Komagataeibacter rhaeticus]
MFYIQKIIINNFRGQKKPIELDLKEDVNFIIGRNGTGKTTLINLVNSALSADMRSLIKLDFSKISFSLVGNGSRNHPSITIYKEINEDNDLSMVFSFQESAKSKPRIIRYSMEDFAKPWRMMKVRFRDLSNPMADMENDAASEIQAELSKYVNTSWISVNRAEANRQKDDDKFESPVDKRLFQKSR